MNLHYNSVTKELQMVPNRLMKIKELDSFRLVGGTALALLYGHRNSVEKNSKTERPHRSKKK
jgi:hypothetical protein